MSTDSNINNEVLIMVIDDVPENIQIVLKILENDQYHFSFAIDGKSTWQTLEKNIPDLILLDIMLPDTNGFEICKKLRTMESFKDIPVIFLSAKNERQDINEAYLSGGTDYILKPFEEPEVKTKVKNHVELILLKRKLNSLKETGKIF